jgi:transposase
VDIVTRDRSTEYARGVTIGAPDAVQVADRWHVLGNLREALERLLDRLRPQLLALPPENHQSSPQCRALTGIAAGVHKTRLGSKPVASGAIRAMQR